MLKKRLIGLLALFVLAATGVAAQQRSSGTNLSALDYYEIQQLYAKYCHGLDSAAENGNMFASVFTSDGVYVDASGRSIEGREKLAEFARQDPEGKKGPTNVSHYTTNIIITPTPTGARGQGYVLIGSPAPQRVAQPPGAAAPPAAAGGRGGVNDAGLYQDDLVKTSDGWHIKKRVFVRASK